MHRSITDMIFSSIKIIPFKGPPDGAYLFFTAKPGKD